MALIKCPECRKMISDKAERCPHCGQKFPTHSSSPAPKEAQPTVAFSNEATTAYDSGGLGNGGGGKKLLCMILALALLILIAVAIWGTVHQHKKVEAEEITRLEQMRRDLIPAAEAELARQDSIE